MGDTDRRSPHAPINQWGILRIGPRLAFGRLAFSAEAEDGGRSPDRRLSENREAPRSHCD
jgi:hypothetical protein